MKLEPIKLNPTVIDIFKDTLSEDQLIKYIDIMESIENEPIAGDLRKEGVCSIAKRRLSVGEWAIFYGIVMKAANKHWPYSTRQPLYPVPASLDKANELSSGEQAWINLRHNEKNWDRRTNYGKLRHHMVQWILAHLWAALHGVRVTR